MNINEPIYTAKHLLHWVRALYTIHIASGWEVTDLGDSHSSYFDYVNERGIHSLEEVYLRKKIYSMMSALNLSPEMSLNFVNDIDPVFIENLLNKHFTTFELSPVYGTEYYRIILHKLVIRLLTKECQNPYTYFFKNLLFPRHSADILRPVNEKVNIINREIRNFQNRIDYFLIELIDPKNSSFTESFLINHHKFPVHKKSSSFLFLDLSEIENYMLHEVKLEKGKFKNLQELLNYIYSNFLNASINSYTYGIEWILEDEFGKLIDKKSNSIITLFTKNNRSEYIKLRIL